MNITDIFRVGAGDEKGQGLTEYVLILVLIAVVVIIIMTSIGETSNNTYSTINSAMTK